MIKAKDMVLTSLSINDMSSSDLTIKKAEYIVTLYTAKKELVQVSITCEDQPPAWFKALYD